MLNNILIIEKDRLQFKGEIGAEIDGRLTHSLTYALDFCIVTSETSFRYIKERHGVFTKGFDYPIADLETHIEVIDFYTKKFKRQISHLEQL